MPLRMICNDGSLVDGPSYLAPGGCYRVGRSSRCAFVLGDLSVSRFHAEVTVDVETVRVKDLGSRNGTYIDGERVNEAELHLGQSVRFGNAVFHLVCDERPGPPAKDNSAMSTFVHSKPTRQPSSVNQLSKAQLGVLDLLLAGLAEKEVAAKLEISQHTVHNHIKEIYRKMEVGSRPELLALFVADSKKPGKAKTS
jgi:pSer/pThr/pTyr-binding forkhead associated (FHA) protein